MTERMLRKKAKKQLVCGCKRHHAPTRSWGKSARHQARAAEKQIFRRQLTSI